VEKDSTEKVMVESYRGVIRRSGTVPLDERFYTPRAQAASARSTGSRSSRSESEIMLTARSSASVNSDIMVTARSSASMNSKEDWLGMEGQGGGYNNDVQEYEKVGGRRNGQMMSSRRAYHPGQYGNENQDRYRFQDLISLEQNHQEHQQLNDTPYLRNPRLQGQDLNNHSNSLIHRHPQHQNFVEEKIDNIPTTIAMRLLSLTRHGRVDEVQSMLMAGKASEESSLVNDAIDRNGNTMLAIACQNGNKRMAKLALRHGARIDATNRKGNTALHFCHKYGFRDTLGAYLLSKGANPNIRNAEGRIP